MYRNTLIDIHLGKTQRDLFDPRWIQTFCNRFRIVSRSQTGKLKVSPEKRAELEKGVTCHIGRLKRGSKSGELDQNCIIIADETHFVFNMNDGCTLGFTNNQQVSYADATSGIEGIKIHLRISGSSNACIEPPLMIFQNKSPNYPLINFPTIFLVSFSGLVQKDWWTPSTWLFGYANHEW